MTKQIKKTRNFLRVFGNLIYKTVKFKWVAKSWEVSKYLHNSHISLTLLLNTTQKQKNTNLKKTTNKMRSL